MVARRRPSPHRLITGTTLSGKSTLARAFESVDYNAGIVPIIYDPTMSSEWRSEFVTCDPAQFFAWLREAHEARERIGAYIDEADTMLDMMHRENWWLYSRGRHFAIRCTGMTQRPKMVAPNVRGNVGEMYVFQLSKTDARELADDFAAEGLIEAPELPQGHFLRAYWKKQEDGTVKKVVDKARIF